MKTRTSRFWLILGLAVAALVLSACKAHFITDLKADGSGTFSQEMGFTSDEASTMGLSSSEDFCSGVDTQTSELPPNTRVYKETRGEETWCIFESSFNSLAELQTIYDSMDVTTNQLSITNGTVTYDVNLDLTDSSNTTGAVEMKWIVTMPGSIRSNNADEVNGRTLTWNLMAGAGNHIQASSASTDYTIWIIVAVGLACLCGVAVVVIAVVVFFVLRKKKAAAGAPTT